MSLKKYLLIATLGLFSSSAWSQFFPDSSSCFSNAFNLKLNTSKSVIFACQSIKLTAQYTGSPNIWWSNGNYGSELIVDYSGYYFAYAMDSSGCYDTTQQVYVDVQNQVPVVYSNTFYRSFCSGSSLKLSAYSTFKGKWNTGDTSNEITINKGGDYYYISKSTGGCIDTSSILTITEVTVDKPKIKVTGDTKLCLQDSVIIETTSKHNLSWAPYGYGNRIKAGMSGWHYAIATEGTLGCTINSDSVFITIYEPFAEPLCMITNDSSTGKNMLMWSKTTGKRTEKYEIYRESNAIGEYDKIATLSYSETPKFIDTTSNPKQRAYSYYLKAIDSCGNSAPESIYYTHTTAHLTANLGVSGENNLNWSSYLGIYPISSYAIYRSNKGGKFEEIGRVSSNKNSYTDLTPPSGSNRYYVAIVADVNCGNQVNRVQFRSNQVQFDAASIQGFEAATIANIYPNPASEFVMVETMNAGNYSITDLSGRSIMTGELTKGENRIETKNILQGTYIFNFGNNSRLIQINHN